MIAHWHSLFFSFFFVLSVPCVVLKHAQVVSPVHSQCCEQASVCLQVRFGVLNAGNFGVSQSRKRTFIWGVAPDNILPDWPKPQHVFRSSQLTINLPGNVQVSVHETIS